MKHEEIRLLLETKDNGQRLWFMTECATVRTAKEEKREMKWLCSLAAREAGFGGAARIIKVTDKPSWEIVYRVPE